MNRDLQTCAFQVESAKRTIEVNQILLYVIEINQNMEAATGVDLISAGTAGIDSLGAKKIVSSLGLTGRAYIKSLDGRNYLILKGSPGQRAVLKGTRYLANNPAVAHITVSPKALASGAARMTGLAVVAYAGLRIVESVLRDNDVRLTQLLGTVASDLIKFSIAAGAGFLAGIAAGAFTTIAAGPLVAAILVGLATSVVLSRIDRELGLSQRITLALEEALDASKRPFEAVAKDIHNWERNFIQDAVRKLTR